MTLNDKFSPRMRLYELRERRSEILDEAFDDHWTEESDPVPSKRRPFWGKRGYISHMGP